MSVCTSIIIVILGSVCLWSSGILQTDATRKSEPKALGNILKC